MKNIIFLAAIGCTLAACGPREGAGFTGIGGEPASVSREQGPGFGSSGSYSSLAGPAVEANRNPRRVDKQVRQAFAAPVVQPLEVRLGGETVQMNLVDVRGQRYAVLRPTGSGGLSQSTARSFGAYARTLTGCSQSGPYYSDKNGPGAATALIC